MNHKKLKLGVLLVGFSLSAQAQQSATSSGGDASGSGGTVAYSVGQVVYTTHTGSNGSVAQGVQQAYEISTLLGVENHQIHLIQVYPNPTIDYLTLNVGDSDLSSLNYQLYDIAGKLIESKKITSSIETINMEILPSTIYFLKVTNNIKEVKTFKIIKK